MLSSRTHAAEKIDVSQKNIKFLENFLTASSISAISKERMSHRGGVSLKELKRHQDFNGTLHIHAKQTFANSEVWGADIMIHVPEGKATSLFNLINNPSASMNGILYQHLEQDLQNSQPSIFKPEQKERAFKQVTDLYLHDNGVTAEITDQQIDLIVYVDAQQKAHFAFHIHFNARSKTKLKALPNYIIDASSFMVYKYWNEIKTWDKVQAGGYGGNVKIGKLSYDGLTGHLPSLVMLRDANEKICYLQTDKVLVKTYQPNAVAHFKCETTNQAHNHVYWDEIGDEVNGGYSPNHDALFVAEMTEAMYQSWYQLPVLSENGSPLPVTMITHSPNEDAGAPNQDSAFYDKTQHAVCFGDGFSEFYPLTSIDVGAHELSHGFTDQHSGLVYDDQSGGLNESFSDMAAKAVEYFTFGNNSWDLGRSIKKANNKALRYMDKPSKDCEASDDVFNCSIDDMSQFHSFLELHQISGIFNRVFYLMATSPGWNTKSAFDVMIKANVDYWTPNSTFDEAACGVIRAAKDYRYDIKAIQSAFTTVMIDISRC